MVIEFVPVGTRLSDSQPARQYPSGLPALIEQKIHGQIPACIFIQWYQTIPGYLWVLVWRGYTIGTVFSMAGTVVAGITASKVKTYLLQP